MCFSGRILVPEGSATASSAWLDAAELRLCLAPAERHLSQAPAFVFAIGVLAETGGVVVLEVSAAVRQ